MQPAFCQVNASLRNADKRLSRRFGTLLDRFVSNPGESIPESLNDWGTIKSAYRFFQNPQITNEMLINDASAETARKALDAGGLLIIAHDTTHIDYSGLHVDGLGMNATDAKTKGFLVHSSLAMTESGVPLGMLSQNIWTRDVVKGNDSGKRRQLAIEEKESYKWLRSFHESLQNVEHIFNPLPFAYEPPFIIPVKLQRNIALIPLLPERWALDNPVFL